MGDGMLSLNWNNHKSTFIQVLSKLREKERYTDVSLACQGKFYQVHKLVLSACSEYFESIFENTPCKHPVIVLKDVKSDDLEALLCYMYEGVVSVAQNDLARLIKVAELLQIKGLAIPDDPPLSPENKKVRDLSDERKSPPSKRRKYEENSETNSSPSSPQCTKSQDTENRPRSSKSKVYTDTQESDSPRNQESTETEVVVLVDEPVVKQEPVKEEIQEFPYDSLGDKEDCQYYSHDVRDSSLDSVQNEDVSSLHDNQTEYPQFLEPTVELKAVAGPSGMQGWLSGDLGVENYGDNENSQFGHQQMATEDAGSRRGSYSSTDWKQLHPIDHSLTAPLSDSIGRNILVCRFCKKSNFKKPSDLQMHIRTHTGEKPFKCPHCEYCAARKHAVKTHIFAKHPHLV